MSALSYENFDLRLEPSLSGYLLSVSSPAGEARSELTPFAEAELDAFLSQAIGFLGREISLSTPQDGVTPETFKAFGHKLFERVFSGEVLGRFERSLGLLEGSGKHLRLRLYLEGVPELAGLPWEYLHQHDFLSLSSETPIVRYLEAPQRIKPLAVKPPLNILVVIASPSEYPKLQVEREWAGLEQALADLQKRGLVKLKRLGRATLDALQQELPRDAYHVFHFIGHGDFDPDTRAGALLFEEADGRARKVSASVLKTFLRDESSLRLAVLNACKGARSSQQDPFAGTAQSLLSAGVPAVVAMQFAVSDEAAITFSGSFYRALADSLPIDTALGEARKTMFAAAERSVEWGTPVLFLRAEDGVILNLAYDEALGGLAALAELLHTAPEVRDAARRYRDDFTTARRDIDSLGDYKDLHDQLHKLHYQCYRLIVGKLRSATVPVGGALPEEWRGDDTFLETSEVDLLNILETLRAIVERDSFPAYDTSWLPYLEQAHEALKEATRNLDLGALKRVRSYLERVLNIQPANLNKELEFTARKLDLPQVVRDMTELRDTLERLRSGDRTVIQFAGGVEALTRLDGRLQLLLSQHVAWQTIDTYLRTLLDSGLGARLEREAELLAEDWRDLIRDKAEALTRDRQDGLSKRLREHAATVEAALSHKKSADLERALELYRHCVGLLFYGVDADLKRACDDLRKVGEPLEAILGVLEAAR